MFSVSLYILYGSIENHSKGKVLPDLKQIILIIIYYVTHCYLTMLSKLVI